MKKLIRLMPVTLALVVAVVSVGSFKAEATPDFAKKEKQKCNYCHLKDAGGGKRGFRGKYYQGHKLSFKDFDEKKQAALAGVKPGSMGKDTAPTKKEYTGKD